MANLLLYVAVLTVAGASLAFLPAVFSWAVTGRIPRPIERWLDAQAARQVREGRHARPAARGGRNRLLRRRGRPEPLPDVLHELELARLAGLLQHAYETPRPGQAHHVRASTAAYDDALLRCCQATGVPVEKSRVPLSKDARFELETRLMEAGVQW